MMEYILAFMIDLNASVPPRLISPHETKEECVQAAQEAFKANKANIPNGSALVCLQIRPIVIKDEKV